MATATLDKVHLPVPVLEYPHWRVHFQPDHYIEDRISSLSRCVQLVEQCKVLLRGWDFPHLSREQEEQEFGNNYLASWASFLGIEYWRFYQSGQFLHLNAIEEVVRSDWRKSLEQAAQFHLRGSQTDWEKVPGYLSIANVLYRITEIFEFAARLSEKGVYDGQLEIAIELRRVKGFLLMTDVSRSWHMRCASDSDDLRKSWTVAVPTLIADKSGLALRAAVWFFERFHWLNPPLESLRREQHTFLRGLV